MNEQGFKLLPQWRILRNIERSIIKVSNYWNMKEQGFKSLKSEWELFEIIELTMSQ